MKQAAARKHPELFQDPRSGSVIYRCPSPRVAAGGKRLAEIEAELAELGRESVPAQLTRRAEHRGAMGSLSTDRGRAVAGKLMVMTLHPSSRARRFNAAKVVRAGRGIKRKVTAE